MVLSYNQIDDFAQNIVDKAYPSDNCFPTSINIENFLKEAFNVDVEYLTLSTDGTVLGMFASEPFFIKVWDGDTPVVTSIGPQTIFIDSSLLQKGNLGRRNFTIAHEGAHHICCRSPLVLAGFVQPECGFYGRRRRGKAR